jgi:hypothetical protein
MVLIYSQNPLLVWFLANISNLKSYCYENHFILSYCMPGFVRGNFYPHHYFICKVLKINSGALQFPGQQKQLH